MNEERSVNITLDGKEYPLILTTKATREIAGRYGGLEKLGDQLMQNENFEMAISEIVWLITLLANQAIEINNYRDKSKTLPLLTTDEVELFTSPIELGEFKGAITECLYRGTKRNILSEENQKNDKAL